MEVIGKLSARELLALQDIRKHNGRYTIHWAKKSREKLVNKGLATVTGELVTITEEGKALLASIAAAAK